jgi:hypothetical protein
VAVYGVSWIHSGTASKTQVTLFAGVDDEQEMGMIVPRILYRRKGWNGGFEERRGEGCLWRKEGGFFCEGEGAFYLTVTQKFLVTLRLSS